VSPLERLAGIFESSRRGALVAVSVLLVVLVGYADYLTGWETSLAPFYLLPIALVAWVSHRAVAAGFAVFCGAAWYLVDRLSGHSYSSLAMGYWNTAMQIGFFLVVALTLSSLRRSYDRERASARVDALTGIGNRRSFEEILTLEIGRALRYGRPLTLLYLDVDDFKAVNDRFGHAAGDGVLCLIADVIRRNMRVTDQAARLGGDEFVVLLPETGLEEARVVVSKLLADLKATAGEGLAPVTASAGVASFRRPLESARLMIEKADALMYVVKRRGKNGVDYAPLGEEGAVK
jgi:diguanylate cyclase (GGDEF)-like protein